MIAAFRSQQTGLLNFQTSPSSVSRDAPEYSIKAVVYQYQDIKRDNVIGSTDPISMTQGVHDTRTRCRD